MSDNEEFLARWSRRKRETERAGAAESQSAEPTEVDGPGPSDEPAGEPRAEPLDPKVDLSDLPTIDSIDEATDITAFLRRGIPQELSRAALRRAWSTDPAIRDFVGLAENAWDFNDPDAMPGFGPLDPSKVEPGALASRIVEGFRQVVAALPDTPAAAGGAGQATNRQSNPGKDFVELQAIANEHDASTVADARAASAAPQPSADEKVEREKSPARRRTHGSALPR